MLRKYSKSTVCICRLLIKFYSKMRCPFKCRSGRGSNFGTTSKPLELRFVLLSFLLTPYFFWIRFCNSNIFRTAPCAALGTAYKVWPHQGGQGVGVKRPKITGIMWCLKAKRRSQQQWRCSYLMFCPFLSVRIRQIAALIFEKKISHGSAS